MGLASQTKPQKIKYINFFYLDELGLLEKNQVACHMTSLYHCLTLCSKSCLNYGMRIKLEK